LAKLQHINPGQQFDVSTLHCVSLKSHNLLVIIFDLALLQYFYDERDDPDAEQEIGGMPGIYRFGVDRLENHLKPAVEAGLSSVLLFGVPYNLPKDDYGSAADDPRNPVIAAVKKIRMTFPNITIACDVSIYRIHNRRY